MKYTFKNNFDSEELVINCKDLRSAKTRCSQFYRDYPSSTIIKIYSGRKLFCSKKFNDRFWSDGLRTQLNYNTHKHTPLSPLERRLKLLESKKIDYQSKINDIKKHIKNAKSEIKAIKLNKSSLV